jgi:hypothetical protein
LVNSQLRGQAMAERKDSEPTGSDASATPENAATPSAAKSEKSALPSVESPPLSPAADEPAPVVGSETNMFDPVEDAPTVSPAGESPAREMPKSEAGSAPEVLPPALYVRPAEAPRASAFTPRHKRYALLAASLTIAAALGVVIGALANGAFSKPEAPHVDVASIEERKALQQSIAHLTKEVTTLKANLDTANKAARTQIAKLNDKLAERIKKESADVTGSISAPQTAAPAPADQSAAAATTPTPIPQPRPAQVASVAAEPPPAPQPPTMRSSIVPGWWIRDARDGYVYVEGHGEIYEVVPGAPLPGLGPVEQIKRQDGRWVVVTPRGIIVSMRDRRYFESF